MTGSQARIFFCSVLALMAAAATAEAQWTSDKPPVLKPSDYPPLETEDPPDPNHTVKPEASQALPQPLNGAPRRLNNAVEQQPLAGAGQPVGGHPVRQGPVLPQPAAVQVDALGSPEGPPIGILDQAHGGFGEGLWSGSDRAAMEKLVAAAPLAITDPMLSDLARRVILTKAPPPPGNAPRSFAGTRIEKLLSAGFLNEAGAMAAAAEVPNNEDFAKLQAKAVLLANRADDACGKATETRLTGADVFWLQLRTYCAVQTGDLATADLTREIIKAQGLADPVFDELLQDIGKKKPPSPGAIKQPSPMHLFLLQQAGLPVTIATARKMDVPASILVLRDKRNLPRSRFEAAERVVQSAGSISVSELRALAEEQDLPLSRVAGAAGEAPKLPYYMGQVLLRRAIAIEPSPERKAGLLALALSLGEKNNALPLTAMLQGDLLAKSKPVPETAAYGRRFVQALVLARRFDAASLWAGDDRLMQAIIALASQDAARLTAIQPDLAAFGQSLTANPAPADPDRRYKGLLLGLARTLGVNLPPEARSGADLATSQRWQGKRPSDAVMQRLSEAAQVPERRGEAILLVTNTLHEIGLAAMAPDATMEFVHLLNQMNETRAARALALQALAVYAP